MIDVVVDEIFLLGRKYGVVILWRFDVMSSMCMTTPSIVNLRKISEYDFDSNSVDYCLE